MFGDLLIRWTVRFAVACYATRLICDVIDRDSIAYQRMARAWWTVGCVLFAIHVAAAFHFEHGWNHSAAYAYTAKRTAEVTGWNSGFGIYVGEAFLFFWTVDTVLWWTRSSSSIHRKAYWPVQAIFGFMMFQATFVFGPSLWKPIVVLFIPMMLVLVWRRGLHSGV